jgi:hypothetical protein
MRQMILAPLFLALTALQSAAATTVPTAPACGVERTSDSPGCVNVSTRLQVCERVDGDAGTAIEVRESGQLVQTWQFPITATSGAPFHVVRGDFTGDGVDDIAVVKLVASSNGRVINTYNVCAADGANLERQIECTTVQDYGKVGYFTKQPGAKGCFLLQTTWRYGSEARRGNGTYLVGRWLRLGRDGFEPDSSRPLVARRLLYGFEATLSSLREGTHLAWFLDGRTRTVNCPDPLC